MNVHINLWGVLLAGVSSMVIGMIYYSDAVFGKSWKKLSKVDTKKFGETMPKIMPLLFLAALVTAYVIAYVAYIYKSFFTSSWIGAGIETSLLLWIGISATTLFVHDTTDLKPSKLTAISVGNRLVSLLAMGLIIGWIHP